MAGSIAGCHSLHCLCCASTRSLDAGLLKPEHVGRRKSHSANYRVSLPLRYRATGDPKPLNYQVRGQATASHNAGYDRHGLLDPLFLRRTAFFRRRYNFISRSGRCSCRTCGRSRARPVIPLLFLFLPIYSAHLIFSSHRHAGALIHKSRSPASP